VYILQSSEQKLRDGVRQDPIIFLVDQMLYRAIVMRSSDVHLEPTLKNMRLRYRIDGVLYEQESIEQGQAALVLSRLKVLSSLDIAQRRMPQDGKLMINFDSSSGLRAIDLRISTFPTIFGEKMVVRILDRRWQCLSLDALGCSDAVRASIARLISRQHGFFLVTGPTGSGKTTTLYAMLSALNRPDRNIVTMEDPVEYHIEGITQSQISDKIGFTFECGLRSLVRQDPDVAMVGEIRDRQTAQIAIEAALTGHLVLSTLHTNDSIGAIARLIDMGIEPFMVNAALTAVLAQRLVRLLCESCKYQDVLREAEHIFVQKHQLSLESAWRAPGCKECAGLGHRGRIGIFELLVVDDGLRRLIVQGADTCSIREHVIESGISLLRDDGLAKVRQGVVSLEEFMGVIGFY